METEPAQLMAEIGVTVRHGGSNRCILRGAGVQLLTVEHCRGVEGEFFACKRGGVPKMADQWAVGRTQRSSTLPCPQLLLIMLDFLRGPGSRVDTAIIHARMFSAESSACWSGIRSGTRSPLPPRCDIIRSSTLTDRRGLLNFGFYIPRRMPGFYNKY